MNTNESKSSVPGPSRSALNIIVNVAVSIAVLGACFFGYTLLGERARPARSKPPKTAGTVVTTETLRMHEGPVSIASNGIVVPLREIRLATEVAGRVIEQSPNLRNGRQVAAGEVLIRIDPTVYELEVRRLKSQQNQEMAELGAIDVSIENTKQLLVLASEQVALSKTERTRADTLVERQAASMAEVDVARRSELISKSSLVELENRRRELVAQRQLIVEKQSLTSVELERANLDLSRTTIKSPIRGRVVQSMVEEESYLSEASPFVTIEDTSAVEIRSNLTVQQMYWIWNAVSDISLGEAEAALRDDRVPAVPATIQYRLGTRVYQWQAVLERIDGAGIDVATRTYPCLFRVDEPDQMQAVIGSQVSESRGDGPRRLMRGMFVSVNLLAQPQRKLYQISESAIRPGNRVWLDIAGELRIQDVEIVSREGSTVIVDAAAIEADHPGQVVSVIVSPVSDPRSGMKLTIAGSPEPSASAEAAVAVPEEPGSDQPGPALAAPEPASHQDAATKKVAG